jgi:hypothetical protein
MKADTSPSPAKFATQCLTRIPLSRHKKLVMLSPLCKRRRVSAGLLSKANPCPLKEAYTHDDASTMDRAVAILHVRPPGAILERSDAAHPAVTRLYPEHGGESGGVRGAVAGSLSAGPRGPAAPADRHRRLCGVSCGAPDGLSAGRPSAVGSTRYAICWGQSGGETTPLPVARSCSSDREGVFLCA